MRPLRAILTLALICAVAHAQTQREDTRRQMSELRKLIDTLDWQNVNFDALAPLERCRALMLLNHTLDELGATALAENDLMGAYLEQQELHDAYRTAPPSVPPKVSTFEDARKIAVALLKGPMSSSPYATKLADTDADGLAAYERLYDRTGREKWADFAADSAELRGMAAFLKAKAAVPEYMTWAQAETERRQAEYEQQMAIRRAATAADDQQKQQEQEAKAAELEKQHAEERAASRQAQQAMAAAQQQTSTSGGDDDDDDWYPGWYNGIIDNAKRHPRYRDGPYQAQARERVAQRRGGTRPAGGRGRP